MVLNDTKGVEQEGCDMKRMRPRWLETAHRVAGEARRKIDRRNSMLNLKLETDFWSQLWKTITSPILLRFG
jgi:hypothetical protein